MDRGVRYGRSRSEILQRLQRRERVIVLPQCRQRVRAAVMRPAELRIQLESLVVILDSQCRAAGEQKQLREAVVAVRLIGADANVRAKFALCFREEAMLDVRVSIVIMKMTGAGPWNRARPSLHESERLFLIRRV